MGKKASELLLGIDSITNRMRDDLATGRIDRNAISRWISFLRLLSKNGRITVPPTLNEPGEVRTEIDRKNPYDVDEMALASEDMTRAMIDPPQAPIPIRDIDGYYRIPVSNYDENKWIDVPTTSHPTPQEILDLGRDAIKAFDREAALRRFDRVDLRGVPFGSVHPHRIREIRNDDGRESGS